MVFDPEKLKATRLKAGLSQQQVAAAVKIPQSIISRFESGLRTPNANHIARLAKALKVSAAKFMSKELPQ